MLEEFLALSRILTGMETLDPRLGREYLDRLTSTPYDSTLREVLTQFRALINDGTLADQVKRLIVDNDHLRATTCQIILLWYTSAMQDNPDSPVVPRYGTEEAYFSALGWQVIGAHVPGLSGGYFGHWRYRPDNEPPEAV